MSEGYYGRLELLLLDVTAPICGHFTVARLPSARWMHTMVHKCEFNTHRQGKGLQELLDPIAVCSSAFICLAGSQPQLCSWCDHYQLSFSLSCSASWPHTQVGIHTNEYKYLCSSTTTKFIMSEHPSFVKHSKIVLFPATFACQLWLSMLCENGYIKVAVFMKRTSLHLVKK